MTRPPQITAYVVRCVDMERGGPVLVTGEVYHQRLLGKPRSTKRQRVLKQWKKEGATSFAKRLAHVAAMELLNVSMAPSVEKRAEREKRERMANPMSGSGGGWG